MTPLQTRVQVSEPDFRIDYSSRLFFIGSCFADTMGRRMQKLKFNTCVNPFGVLYNPHSIAQNLLLLLQKNEFTPEDLSFHNELWFSFSHYTLFSHTDPKHYLKIINAAFDAAKKQISSTNVLSITLGTSWYYTLRESGKLVANCHKLPADRFQRSFSKPEHSFQVLFNALKHIQEINPGIQVLFTVSPIRHWKDGAVGNQRSKSALILAIQELEEKLDNVHYFPAYELFMDELRDYRFYAADMLHPSEMAQSIVWERFSSAYLSPESLQLSHRIQKLREALAHRPRFPETHSYQSFVAATRNKFSELEKEFPFLNFDEELQNLC